MNSTNLLESPITILKNINHLLIDALLAADIKTIGDLVNASEDKVIIVLKYRKCFRLLPSTKCLNEHGLCLFF